MSIQSRSRGRGFTLIEMSVVIVLVAAMIGTVAVVFTSMLKQYQYKETDAKLQAIQEALYNYRVAFNTLPCPADITLPIGDTHFGVMAQNMGTCTGGIPTSNFSGSDGTAQEPREGMVPTQALHLPDDYAFDGWGHRIMYAVNKDLTQVGAFAIVNGYDPTPRMSIKDEQGGTATNLAGYVVVSFGPNGHGAYPRKGGNVRIGAGSTNVDELNNCDCNSALPPASTGLDGVFVQKNATLNPGNAVDAFDDIVVYATRADMILQSSMAWSLGPQYTFAPGGGGAPTGTGTGTGASGAPSGGGPIF